MIIKYLSFSFSSECVLTIPHYYIWVITFSSKLNNFELCTIVNILHKLQIIINFLEI